MANPIISWIGGGYGVPFGYDEYVAMAARLRTLKRRELSALTIIRTFDVRSMASTLKSSISNIPLAAVAAKQREKKCLFFSWDEVAEPAGLF